MYLEIDGIEYDISTEQVFGCSTSMHGLLRVQQRAGLTERRALRLIEHAWERGRTAEQLPRRWQREYLEHRNRLLYNGYPVLKVYQKILFVFSHFGKLITAYELPEDFFKARLYDNSKKVVRNFRKYQRMMVGI